MMINNNISFETVNCDCCQETTGGKFTTEIMDLINKDLPKDQKRKSLTGYVKIQTIRVLFQGF